MSLSTASPKKESVCSGVYGFGKVERHGLSPDVEMKTPANANNEERRGFLREEEALLIRARPQCR